MGVLKNLSKKVIDKTKEDLNKIKSNMKKEEKPAAKVLEPTIKKTAKKTLEKEPEQDFGTLKEKEQVQEQVQPGYIIKYAKELVFEVVDEEGQRIPCKTPAEAEILSRLIKLGQ